MKSFQSTVKKFEDTKLWAYYFLVDPAIAESLIEGKNRRVTCSINGEESFQCAIMHGSNDLYFINLSKKIREKYHLLEGEQIAVSLEKDKSKYGLPFPEAFREVLDSDPEAKRFFEGLTPGKQRTLLYIIDKPKSIDKKIEKSLVIAAHLVKMNGKIDYKLLNQDFKDFRF